MTPKLTRRGFLVALGVGGAGLSLGIRRAEAASAASAAFEPNVFVRLEPSGDLFVTCSRAEMGQGVRATLPWIIAAEMGADFDRVTVVQAPGDAIYGNQNTDGSTSIRNFWPLLRELGAAGRVLLAQAGAAQLGVVVDAVQVEDHHVTDPASGRSIPFGELAEAAAALDVPRELPLRPELGHLHTDKPFTDAKAIVDGTAVYGADTVLDDLVVAMVARPPDLGGEVASYDDAEARKVPGVIDVIELPRWKAPALFKPVGGVAVVATNTWAAMKGREALQITFAPGKQAEASTAGDLTAMRALVDTRGRRKRKVGNADKALEEAAEVHTAVYEIPHLVHAPMEPPAAVASVTEAGCEVWAPVQAPQRTRKQVAAAVGLPKKKVKVNVTLLGGGFGRKGKPDFVSEAAYLSKELGRPVRVQWDREDDVRHSYYHACAVQRLDAGFDSEGQLTAWRYRVCSPTIFSTFLPIFHRLQGLERGQGLSDFALDVPNVAYETLPAPSRVRIGWMRSVYNINHALATQCFVDELAVARGVSTPQMLKTVMGPRRVLTRKEAHTKIWNYGASHDRHPVDVGRWYDIVDEVVEASGYGADAGEGRALGFASHLSFNSYVACVVAMTRDAQGRPKVDEAWIGIDCGQVLNEDRVRGQLEGAVIFGISVALYGEITLADGAVQQGNFHDYRVARIGDAPRRLHVILANNGSAPGGVGEPGVPPVAPAILNGWYALTGERVRSLPMIRATG